MEVIGAGWGRTGTMSLKVALDELDLPCYHVVETFKHPSHPEQWMQAADGKPVDFRQLLEGCGYTATTDWPAATFYKQLMELYPDAKAVRNVPWYVSAVHKLISPGRGASMDMVHKLIWDGDVKGCFPDDPHKAKELFKQHNQEVMQAVPADKLLVFEVSQGWGPLCKFLGKPVPQQPFPHINVREEWRQRLQHMRWLNAALTYGVPAVAAALAAAGVALGHRWLQRR